MSDRLTANVGIRFDKNHGADQSGNVVAKDSAWSPRLGIIWDPTGKGLERDRQRGEVVAAISNPVADSSAASGNPQTRMFIYRGASINGRHDDARADGAGHRRCSTGSSTTAVRGCR